MTSRHHGGVEMLPSSSLLSGGYTTAVDQDFSVMIDVMKRRIDPYLLQF